MSDNQNQSTPDYNLTLMSDGTVEVTTKSGNRVTDKGTVEHPPITKIMKVRTLTITEAADAPWIYVDPPGMWYPID